MSCWKCGSGQHLAEIQRYPASPSQIAGIGGPHDGALNLEGEKPFMDLVFIDTDTVGGRQAWIMVESDRNVMELMSSESDNVERYKLGNYSKYKYLWEDTHEYLVGMKGYSWEDATELCEEYDNLILTALDFGHSPYEVGNSIVEADSFSAENWNAEDRPEEERMTRAEAEELAAKMINLLQPYCDSIDVCGSFRRGRDDPGDLDIVIIMKPRVTLPQIVDDLEGEYTAVNWLGEKKTQMVIDGVKVDVRTTTPRAKGAALLYFTGPAGYNIGIRRSAKSKGMKLNEYGIFNRDTNEYLGGATEEEIYAVLGKNFRPATERRAEEIQEFNSVVIAPKRWNSAGPLEKSMMIQVMMQEALVQDALVGLEQNVRLGLISEKQAMELLSKLLG